VTLILLQVKWSLFGRKYRIKKKDNDWIIRLDTYRRFLRWHYETYIFHYYCVYIFVLRVMYVFIVREEWKGVLLLSPSIFLGSWLSSKYLWKKMKFTYIHIVFSYICWFKDIKWYDNIMKVDYIVYINRF
jgi:hypothetical protein